MKFLYNLGIYAYGLLVRIAAIGMPKARLWVKGRRNWKADLKEQMPSDRPVLWFHCASLGEFEQGRPVIEIIRQNHPDYYILLTFFSPSGYEMRKDYAHADHVCYLPLDTPSNARSFVDIVKPKLVIFIKYEFWINHLTVCFDRDIPVVLVSAVFRAHQSYFKKRGRIILDSLRRYGVIFVQDIESRGVLSKFGIDSRVSGDTRIDRVLEISRHPKALSFIQEFSDKPTLVFGSIWQQDEKVFVPFIRKNKDKYRFIIAPHEVDRVTVDRYLSLFEPSAIKYAHRNRYDVTKHSVLVIDQIGLLAHVYQHAYLAYIGGAFGHGLHNILEPTAYSVPVICGPKYHKFPEAVELIEKGGVFAVESYEQFEGTVEAIEVDYQNKQGILKAFYHKHEGATDRAYNHLVNKGLI